jgi:hypothetical protein
MTDTQSIAHPTQKRPKRQVAVRTAVAAAWARPQGTTARLVPAATNTLFERMVWQLADRVGVAEDDWQRDLGLIAQSWGYPPNAGSLVQKAIDDAARHLVEHREQAIA